MATIIGGSSRVRQDLLRYLHERPGVEGHVRAIARALGRDPTAVSRELRRLEEQAVVTSTSVGSSKVYRLNPRSPIARELRTLVQRTLGVEARIAQALADLSGVREAWIFGSYASGRERPGSDVDLLVVGTHDSNALRRRIAAAEHDLLREINLVEYAPTELRKLKARRSAFIEDVLEGPRVRVPIRRGR
ncbi:MAG TPA: nucleotidyltransferase domain-containing protein [Candidatus Limnocylindria bacterium]|nr:nucleotidyltransferase domain-containing protein [Candidatus Limnocylindria bacterium]